MRSNNSKIGQITVKWCFRRSDSSKKDQNDSEMGWITVKGCFMRSDSSKMMFYEKYKKSDFQDDYAQEIKQKKIIDRLK